MGTAWSESAGRALAVPCLCVTPRSCCGWHGVGDVAERTEQKCWELGMPGFTSASPRPCPDAAHVSCAGGADTRPASSSRAGTGW